MSSQDKSKEIAFFDQYANMDEYNVFTDASNNKLVTACLEISGLRPGMQVADLGCGWGVFTRLLRERGLRPVGIDISQALLVSARREDPAINYAAGDVEFLPLASESLDGILLSGILHHLPDPSACAREVYRVLKPNGRFVAFDPNRRNPFMWLYRDWESLFYTREGVTKNERPVIASELARVFSDVGFAVSTNYLSGLSYRYIASPLARKALPVYNFLDSVLFQPAFMKAYSAFVITSGVKT